MIGRPFSRMSKGEVSKKILQEFCTPLLAGFAEKWGFSSTQSELTHPWKQLATAKPVAAAPATNRRWKPGVHTKPCN